MAKTLIMTFKTDTDTNVSISVSEPKDELTGAEVKAAGDAIVASNAIMSSGGYLVSIARARLSETASTNIELIAE